MKGPLGASPARRALDRWLLRLVHDWHSSNSRSSNQEVTMSVKLNKRAYEFAKELIDAGKFVADDRDDWSEHQPSAEQENAFIARHGWTEYATWHLGLDDEHDEETKGRYKFPY